MYDHERLSYIEKSVLSQIHVSKVNLLVLSLDPLDMTTVRSFTFITTVLSHTSIYPLLMAPIFVFS